MVDLFQPVDADVGVDLCGGEAFVSEEFLDDAEVGAGIEHVGCEAVAEGVGGYFASSGQDLPDVFFDDALNAACGEGAAAEVYKCDGVVRIAEVVSNTDIVADGGERVGS